jgi:hypothetical protein
LAEPALGDIGLILGALRPPGSVPSAYRTVRLLLRGLFVQTVYDWLTVAIFAGLITLFLQRSSMAEPVDSILHYFPPAIGCAVANYFGNAGDNVIAIVILIGIAAYVWFVLRPMAHWKN